MQVRNGIAVSPGVAMGPAFVLGVEDFRIPHDTLSVTAVESEIARLRCALENVAKEISANEALAEQHLGKEYAAIFAAHLQFARDPKLLERIESLIREQHQTPEYAATQVLRKFARELQHLGDKYLAERAADIFDLERSLLRHLLGEQREELSHLTAPVVVLAHNLTPSETAGLNSKYVKAFVTETGGSTSHTAILAGALEIPAIVGVGEFISDISGGEMIIVDGNEGRLIIAPDAETQARYLTEQERFRTQSLALQKLKLGRVQTKDKVDIEVCGNIEFPEEAKTCKKRGADGVGLYRTEFLYLGSMRERTEEDHYNAYSKVLKKFPELPVTIRTLDVGADKIPDSMRAIYRDHSNPELGLRSIRVSLEHTDLFKTQLRAILRAAVHGNVRVMFPLVSSIGEFRQAKMVLRDVCEDLEEQKIEHKPDIPVGMMVEVPSAAIMADEFAREVDFFSIGTNDLIQYTLAADRSDPSVAKYYNASDPSVLFLVRRVLFAARDANLPVSVCGQMSSDPKFIPLLLGMGLRQLSVTPQKIPLIKQLICNISIEDCQKHAKKVYQLDLARDIENFLRGELKRFLPESEVSR
ncbi:phosphoenolpyruvate--protein phosphotransferase [Thalassoglobus polymorphus]|uniref:Phosphoenolpyruvate-protein phosphotransferase n=1 Tax=Thalassoglobus polymorphus TaxID=2527994 RepID=A0A517QQY1_9PLAN|nr:phosphoenolpyruvate--protein phosphotransferase [Thalassoglobus polymorphus]QDT34047.1 Phosphoenolpyruvate-protein phosphotransferase [Thalassoglobus polymorphus]